MPICPRCDHGWTFIEEDGRRVPHPCFHCGTTGEISEEQEFRNRLDEVIYRIAEQSVLSAHKAANDEDEYYAAERSAELRLSNAEYIGYQIENEGKQLAQIFDQSFQGKPSLLRAIVDLLDPEPDAEPELAPVAATPPTPIVSDDIPF